MGIDGVSPVQKDGRIRLPQSIRDKYVGDSFAWVEREPGKIYIERVEADE